MKTKILVLGFLLYIFICNGCLSPNCSGVVCPNGSECVNGECVPSGGPATEFSDINGNVYNSIIIGSQVWMTSNLKVTKFQNGDNIVTGLSQTQWNSTNLPAYTTYDDNLYGKLYNWHAINDSRNICPQGWHVPDESEVYILINYLGGISYAGGRLKDVINWQNPNFGATNTSGFTGRPGGYYFNGITYIEVQKVGRWWTTTDDNSTTARMFELTYDDDDVTVYQNITKQYGLSCRCLRD